MRLVTTGMPRRRARAATPDSSPKRRTSTSTISTGERAADRRARISSAQAASASRSTGARGLGKGRRARRSHLVARQLEVHGLRVAPRRGQHARDAGARGGRVVEARLVARHLAEHLELGVERLGLVVQQQPRAALVGAGRARDHDHRRLLREGRGDRVHEVEGPGAVGDGGHRGRAAHARRRVRGEAHRRLVGQRVEGQPPVRDDRVEERQREVAGDAEDLAGPRAFQRAEQRRRDGGLHARSRRAFSAFPGRSCASPA